MHGLASSATCVFDAVRSRFDSSATREMQSQPSLCLYYYSDQLRKQEVFALRNCIFIVVAETLLMDTYPPCNRLFDNDVLAPGTFQMDQSRPMPRYCMSGVAVTFTLG
jgi:hypothetical protein